MHTLYDQSHTDLNASLVVTVEPTDEPVAIEDFMAQVTLDDDNEAQVTIAERYLTAARQRCENWCSRSFASRTYTLTLDRFPLDDGWIYLKKPPVTSVTSITYYDGNGTQQTLNPSTYQVDLNPVTPRITPNNGGWPTTKDGISRVVITYVAGYTVETLPSDLWLAILMDAADSFEHRWGQTDQQLYMNPKLESLLWQYRVV